MTVFARFLLKAIRVYQYVVSPFGGRSCRYHPSCSVYAAQSIRRFGAAQGGWMALRRICRCHPYCAGGYDPVPEKKEA